MMPEFRIKNCGGKDGQCVHWFDNGVRGWVGKVTVEEGKLVNDPCSKRFTSKATNFPWIVWEGESGD